MTKIELEDVINDTHKKLDEGITVFIKDRRGKDAIINSLISGMAFAVGSIIIDELRKSHIRRKNKQWIKYHRES